MKATKFSILLLAAVATMNFLPSCSSDPSKDSNSSVDDKKTAEEHNDAKFTDGDNNNDAQFVVDAADISLAEVSLGKLAEKNAVTNNVKELGTMMIKDHQKAYDDLYALAKSKNISVPETMGNKSLNDHKELSEKKGNEFDKAYCDAMVSGHKHAIAEFEKASKESSDPDIQTWAANMLPTLRSHLDHSMNCQEEINKSK